jgi:hypothetical protein
VKAKILLVASFMIAVVSAGSSAAPPAGPPHVSNVVVLDVGANMQKFIDLSHRMDALTAKLQSTGKARFWDTTWAGSNAGHLVVVVEYPSLASMAASQEKMMASPEYAKWIADAEASGIKVVSQSLLTEVHP